MLQTMFADDFMWSAINNHITGRARTTNTRFINLNCPVCHLYGESRDTRKRCGIKRNTDGVGINCFNCGFKTRYRLGHPLNFKLRQFLTELGLSEKEVQQLNLKALQYRRMIESSQEAQDLIPSFFQPPEFPVANLPKDAKSFIELANSGETNPDFLDVVEYLFSRGDEVSNSTSYYWSP